MRTISQQTVIVIGAGPAGMMAAIQAAENKKNKVIILDKMDEAGLKLLITGKNKCNLTHSVNKTEELMEGYPSGSQFLNSSFSRFASKELLAFFETRGVPCKEERGKRMFPVSEKASDVRNALLKELSKKNVTIKLNSPVMEIITENNKVKAIRTGQKEIINADKIILAAGGMTYPWTGSTGDGYMFARKLGHNIIPPRPSLVSLEILQTQISFALEGLALKNVKAILKHDNKVISEKLGEMVFTSYGISGPIILYLSRKAVNILAEKKGEVTMSLDLKPALSKDKLAAKFNADLDKNKKRIIKNMLEEYLPQKMITVLLSEANVPADKQCCQISSKDKSKIIDLIKSFNLTITKPRGMSEAEVTQGGIDLKEVEPKTMESKIISGLYFAGEILDIDGFIGGYNLQAAFSTGFTAGKHIAN